MVSNKAYLQSWSMSTVSGLYLNYKLETGKGTGINYFVEFNTA